MINTNTISNIEFKVERLDKNGNIVVNNAGDTVYDIYEYNYNKITVSRLLAAKKLFILNSKEYSIPPRSYQELGELLNREIEKRAFNALLMKKLDNGGYEKFEPSTYTEYSIIDRLKGEDYENLMRVQEDFFSRLGLQSTELMTQSLGMLTQFGDIMKELTEASKSSGMTVQEMMDLVMTAAQTSDLSQETTQQKSSTTETISNEI